MRADVHGYFCDSNHEKLVTTWELHHQDNFDYALALFILMSVLFGDQCFPSYELIRKLTT
jgi:hypothetical protein